MMLEGLDHPKTLDLAARLKISIPTAIGHLELLWAFTAKKSPAGNIGKWPDGSIARACFWEGDPELFIESLVSSGFINKNDQHRLLIHDWQDHAPRWVRSKLSRSGESILDCSGDYTSDCSGDCTADYSGDSKGREVKGREGKLTHNVADEKTSSATEGSENRNGNTVKAQEVEEVLNFLNQKTGKDFRAKNPKGDRTKHFHLVRELFKKGYTAQDCRTVIARKHREWHKDQKMASYLRPSTLFRASNFETYIGECVEE